MESFSPLLLEFAQREDSIFYFVLFLSAAAFLVAETMWLVRRLKHPLNKASLLKKLPPDDARFEVLWTIVPALVLVLLGFVHTGKSVRSRTAEIQRSLPRQEKVADSGSQVGSQVKHYVR